MNYILLNQKRNNKYSNINIKKIQRLIFAHMELKSILKLYAETWVNDVNNESFYINKLIKVRYALYDYSWIGIDISPRIDYNKFVMNYVCENKKTILFFNIDVINKCIIKMVNSKIDIYDICSFNLNKFLLNNKINLDQLTNDIILATFNFNLYKKFNNCNYIKLLKE